MSIFDSVLASLKNNVLIRKSGKAIAIPFYKMPRLSKVLPGIMKARYVVVTAGQKEGKTQLTDFLFVYQAIEWLMENPNKGISLKVIYFSLELSKETKVAQAICYRLLTKYDILISPDHLMSIFDGYILDEKIISIIESQEFKEWFSFFEKCVEFVDHIRHPVGMNIYVENYAKQNGRFEYKEIDWDDNGTIVKKKVISRYIPNDEEEIVEIVVDHFALLSEKGKTLYECIKTLSSEYMLRWRDLYKYAPTAVQQQSSESLTQQFTTKGNNILDKVRPTSEGLANCKD